MTHPNALASAITTALAALILKVAQHYGYAHVTAVQALGAAGFIITTVLFLGRRVWAAGLIPLTKGIVQALLHGKPATK